jgi:hypothetical protein
VWQNVQLLNFKPNGASRNHEALELNMLTSCAYSTSQFAFMEKLIV